MTQLHILLSKCLALRKSGINLISQSLIIFIMLEILKKGGMIELQKITCYMYSFEPLSSSYLVYLAHRKNYEQGLERKGRWQLIPIKESATNSYPLRRARSKESSGLSKIRRRRYTRKINKGLILKNTKR